MRYNALWFLLIIFAIYTIAEGQTIARILGPEKAFETAALQESESDKEVVPTLPEPESEEEDIRRFGPPRSVTRKLGIVNSIEYEHYKNKSQITLFHRFLYHFPDSKFLIRFYMTVVFATYESCCRRAFNADDCFIRRAAGLGDVSVILDYGLYRKITPYVFNDCGISGGFSLPTAKFSKVPSVGRATWDFLLGGYAVHESRSTLCYSEIIVGLPLTHITHTRFKRGYYIIIDAVVGPTFFPYHDNSIAMAYTLWLEYERGSKDHVPKCIDGLPTRDILLAGPLFLWSSNDVYIQAGILVSAYQKLHCTPRSTTPNVINNAVCCGLRPCDIPSTAMGSKSGCQIPGCRRLDFRAIFTLQLLFG